MVIKSRTRKDKDFRQMVDYIHKDEATNELSFTYTHNMVGVSPNDRDAMVARMEENDRFRKDRKRSVVAYHDYLSFSPKDTETLKSNPSILHDLTQKYIQFRSPNSVALARVHFDKSHVHIHCLISGTERGSSKVTRISHKQFREVKERLWEYQKERYPELVHSYAPGQNRAQKKERGERAKDTEKAMQKRGALQTVKAELRERIGKFLGLHEQADTFLDALQADGIETYKYRGVEIGVLHENRKHRFTTLFKGQAAEQEKVKALVAERREAYKKAKEAERLASYLQRNRKQVINRKPEQDLELGR